ncbi:hypothetical protein GIB67_024634 [Kingdonia uniflora]|uniref:tyrosine decarboxylase n=1 Tax=Kingdonia uniflora TaxID=39325 RepID=A0A7J7LP55_9MAGN|nr:hypothetical protein GIB67_024634 [Kingdonia uniflora]
MTLLNSKLESEMLELQSQLNVVTVELSCKEAEILTANNESELWKGSLKKKKLKTMAANQQVLDLLSTIEKQKNDLLYHQSVIANNTDLLKKQDSEIRYMRERLKKLNWDLREARDLCQRKNDCAKTHEEAYSKRDRELNEAINKCNSRIADLDRDKQALILKCIQGNEVFEELHVKYKESQRILDATEDEIQYLKKVDKKLQRLKENSSNSSTSMKPMDAEQLRENAHKMVDFIADYYKTIESFPVLSQVEPGYLQKLLPDSAPDHPESLQQVLNDVQDKILPGVTHWQSPDYFAYFPSNSSIAGFLGEMLSAGLNIVGFSWVTSPAATELEVIVLDWLAKMLKLPEEFLSVGQGGGVIQGTASEAVLVVLLAARDKVLKRVGKNSLPKLVAYASNQAHASLQKACQIGGIHPENCRLLKTDSSTSYALSPDALQEAIFKDIKAGLIPFFLSSTVGTTSSTAVDPLSALGKIAKTSAIWFHVDAAYAGSACICPEYRHYIDGVEEADSLNMNAHKWFLTNFDCSVLWVQDRNALIQSLSTNPEYLKNKASLGNMVVDYKDWQIPLGRRFRSLKLWMVLRLYGLENLQSYIRNHIQLAKHFEELVAADPRFEIVTPRTFALVCFRLCPLHNGEDCGNQLNHNLLDAVNSTGKLFISHTVLSGNFILRFAVGAPLTEERHVNAAWKVLQDEATTLLATGLQALSGNFILRFVVGASLTEERHVNAAWKVLQDEATTLLAAGL